MKKQKHCKRSRSSAAVDCVLTAAVTRDDVTGDAGFALWRSEVTLLVLRWPLLAAAALLPAACCCPLHRAETAAVQRAAAGCCSVARQNVSSAELFQL